MNIKKLTSLLLALVLTLSFAACGGGGSETTGDGSTTTETTTETTNETTTENTTGQDSAAMKADQELIDNVNAVLAADEATNGKPALYSKALAVLEKGGVSLPLVPQAKVNTFHWNSTSNRFEVITMASKPLTKNDFAGKKIIIYGDSITYGYNAVKTEGEEKVSSANRWATLLQNALGATIDNRGKNSYCITTGAKERKGTAAKTHFDAIVALKDQADYVIVALGVNDWTRSNLHETVKLGELGSTDSNTIYGAYNLTMKALAETYKDSGTKIIFATPTPTNWLLGKSSGSYHSDLDSKTANDNGYTLQDICQAIKETAALYGVYVMDMHTASGINSTNGANYLADNLHPNAAGHRLMAAKWEEYLLANFSYIK